MEQKEVKMQSTSISNVHLRELHMLISKMSLQDCCMLVWSEFGLSWRVISRTIRNARLPMTPISVANVLKKYTLSLTNDKVADIITRLRLKSIAIHPRTWHVIKLMEQIKDVPIDTLIRSMPSRIVEALKNSPRALNRNRRPKVQAIKLGDFIFISVQMVSNNLRHGDVLYIACPPGQAVAFVSTLYSKWLRPCVQGLGYKKYEDARLNGKDIMSLLRIFDNGTNTANVNVPEYVRTPCTTRGGIDFTNGRVTRNYLSQMFGPDPPILDTLTVESAESFYDHTILNKKVKMTLKIKSANTFSTLQKWAELRAISPTSNLFKMYHTIKSNQIVISDDK